MEAAIYTRVSTDEQRDTGYSLQEQEHRCKKYCEKHNWSITSIYREDHSAKSFDRPEWKKLIKQIKSKEIKVDVIVVAKLDRFSRNAFEAFDIINKLNGLRIKVLSLEDNSFIDFDKPSSFLKNYFTIGFAQWDNLNRADATKRGMRQAAKDGRTVGRAPKGYINNKLSKTVEIDQESSKLIIKGFELLSTGAYNIEEVRRILTKEGLKNCSKQTFLNIVRNKYYTGIITLKKDGEEGEQEEVIGNHEPIITKELFEKVQAVCFKKRPTQKSTQKEIFPLRGFLHCQRCGSKLTASESRSRNKSKYPYYHCQNGCKERFRADYADIYFEDYLYTFQIKKSVISLYKLILEEIFGRDSLDREQKKNALNATILKSRSRISSLEEKFLDNDIELNDYKNMKGRLLNEIILAENQINDINIVKSSFDEYIEGSLLMLENLKGYYKNSPIQVKQKIIGSIFTEKLIYKENKFRTTKINEFIRLMTMNINELDEIKNGQTTNFSNLSTYAPPLGLEPRTL